MRSLGITVSLLFSLCACVFSVADSWLQPEWIEDLKNINNNEDSEHQSPHLLRDEITPRLTSKGNSVILSVTREPEEDLTDVYSLEENEHDTTENEQTEQDDNPIIISSEPVQEEVTVIFSESSESNETLKTNGTEIPPKTSEHLGSTELLKRLDKMMTQIKTQERLIIELKKNERKMKDKFDQIDHKIRGNNIIFLNIRESKHENYKSILQKVIQILNRIMKLRVSTENIVMASRINGRTTDKFRPVVVTFTNFATKLKVLAARHKLKKSKFGILDDYSEEVNQTRRLLLPYLYENRRQGHKVSMFQDKLIVNGVKTSLSDLRQESSKKIQEENSKPKLEDKNSQDILKAERNENVV